ncbi:Histone-lysine N-methyltransferase SETD8 [Cricetulus griseus]|uniref:N-lysine methyltransferase KMT5A n=2 Tax=Cricetulus griseus TaxID=10029 RepID=G3HTT3_CRIGR|nr:Histone-lysine N-methyltransferase SETD8 [Cricetulus griseus]
MGEVGTRVVIRPFPGAPRRHWWKQPQQRQQKLLWWPACGSSELEGDGRTSKALAGLQKNALAGQSEIYDNMSPDTCSGMSSALQEENTASHHKIKCLRKKLARVYRKQKKQRNDGNVTQSAMKPKKLKIKKAKRDPLAHFSKRKSTKTAKTPQMPFSCYPTRAVIAKQAARKKSQRKKQPNRKVKGFSQVRRSSRKSKAELQSEKRKKIDELIESGKEEGMKIDLIDGKGRGVITTKRFSRGDFVVEYHGDLIEITDGKKREALYEQDPSTGCYMYYFQYLSKTYCVDATRETNRLGRLINHSKCGNCHTKLHDINGVPHLILIASRDIAAGEELLYDYGDRSKASIEAHPWLKH